ncbi:MAG TPA: DUF2975 domain-containing protein [Candidatus Tidjanibacter gallistercoris]|nr:DUF2975 domain-containing protein [Candidatus Tidjanibacter gallistercoris]
MKSKKIILRRITTLYVVFFVVIVFGIIQTVSRFSGEDFNTGRNDARRMVAAEKMEDGRNVELLYELRVATSTTDFDIPIYRNDADNVTLRARPALLDLVAVMPDGVSLGGFAFNSYSITYGILAMLIYAAIFVILFVIIGSLRKSIRNDDVFRKSNIALTRAIGILLIAASLLFSLMSWLEARAAAPYFAGSPYAINTAFPFNFGEIIMGVLIFIIAEIFSISSSLSEEQKLTI